jgi:O-antigen/teichoic acid export membrane protein
VLFAMLFSDAGISASLIKSKTIDRAEWSTSFWFVSALGAALAAIITAIGYAISIFLHEPNIFPIIAALSIITLLQAMTTVPGAAMQHENKFTRLAAIETAATLLSIAATVAAAIAGWGAWALVAQQVTHYTVKIILTALYSSFRPLFTFRLPAIHKHLHFGKNILGSNCIYFIKDSMSPLMIGKTLGTASLGIFSMSTLFSNMPNRVISGPFQSVLFPRIAKLTDKPDTVSIIFFFTSRMLATLLIPAMAMVAIAHEPIFKIILSEKWVQSGTIFMLLAPAAVLQAITALRTTIATAFDKTDIILKQSIEISALYLLILACTISFGLEWVAIGVTITGLLYIPRSVAFICPLINTTLTAYFKTFIWPLATTLAALIIYSETIIFTDMSDLAQFAVAFAIGLVALITSIALQLKVIKTDLKFLQNLEWG